MFKVTRVVPDAQVELEVGRLDCNRSQPMRYNVSMGGDMQASIKTITVLVYPMQN